MAIEQILTRTSADDKFLEGGACSLDPVFGILLAVGAGSTVLEKAIQEGLDYIDEQAFFIDYASIGNQDTCVECDLYTPAAFQVEFMLALMVVWRCDSWLSEHPCDIQIKAHQMRQKRSCRYHGACGWNNSWEAGVVRLLCKVWLNGGLDIGGKCLPWMRRPFKKGRPWRYPWIAGNLRLRSQVRSTFVINCKI